MKHVLVCYCFTHFSVLISGKVNTDKSLWEQPSIIFQRIKGSSPKSLRTVVNFNALKFETRFTAQQCGQFCEHSVCTWKNVYSTVLGCTVTCVHTHHTYLLEVKASSLLTGLFKSVSLLTEICHYLRRKRELNAVLTYLHFFSGLCLTNSYCFKSFPTLPIRCVFLSYFVLKILFSFSCYSWQRIARKQAYPPSQKAELFRYNLNFHFFFRLWKQRHYLVWNIFSESTPHQKRYIQLDINHNDDDEGKHVPNTSYVLGTVLSILHSLTHSILTVMLRGSNTGSHFPKS